MDSLIDRLELDLEWAEANEWESPIMLADDLKEAIRIIKSAIRYSDPNFYSTANYEPPTFITTCSSTEG